MLGQHRPRRRTTVRALSLVVLILSGVPAQARAVTVALYPLDARGLARSVVTDLQDLVVDGAMRVAARSDRLQPLEPMLVAPRCGGARTAQASCLARVAGRGALLVGEAVRQGGDALVTLHLVDGRQRISREAWFRVSLAVLTSEPATQALGELEQALAAGLHASSPAAPPPMGAQPPGAPSTVAQPAEPPPPRGPAAEASPPPPPRTYSYSDVPLPPPPRLDGATARPVKAPPPAPETPAAAPGLLREKERSVAEVAASQPGAWKRTAGPLVLGGGALLLAGGAVVGIIDRQLANELDERYAAGSLTGSDRARYDRVHTYNVVANSLFVAGGLAAAAGAYLWVTAPNAPEPLVRPRPGGLELGLEGRF